MYSYREELQHYGVLGMKWGVHRARKRLSTAATAEERNKAISSLEKHRSKGVKKLSALKKKGEKLEKAADKKIRTDALKAANLERKATARRNKMYGRFTSEKKARKLEFMANKLQARADMLAARSNQAKSRVEANAAIMKTFQTQINSIDSLLVEAGRKALSA